MTPDAITLILEAMRLLADSRKNFKSRQVAEARRLLEQALKILEEPDDHSNRTN